MESPAVVYADNILVINHVSYKLVRHVRKPWPPSPRPAPAPAPVASRLTSTETGWNNRWLFWSPNRQARRHPLHPLQHT